jgi:hypothetical protein
MSQSRPCERSAAICFSTIFRGVRVWTARSAALLSVFFRRARIRVFYRILAGCCNQEDRNRENHSAFLWRAAPWTARPALFRSLRAKRGNLVCLVSKYRLLRRIGSQLPINMAKKTDSLVFLLRRGDPNLFCKAHPSSPGRASLLSNRPYAKTSPFPSLRAKCGNLVCIGSKCRLLRKTISQGPK